MNDSKDSGVAAESHPSQKETENTSKEIIIYMRDGVIQSYEGIPEGYSLKIVDHNMEEVKRQDLEKMQEAIQKDKSTKIIYDRIKNNNGNLTKENAKGFDGLDWEYPVYLFKKGNTTSLTIGPITLCPEGYTSEIYYKSLEDNFNKYVQKLIEEFERHSNKQLKECSYIGFKISARLADEKCRRKLR